MKIKKIVLGLFLFLMLSITNLKAEALSLTKGTYTSNDGHKIVINEDNTIKYDDTYALTLKNSEKGSTLTGKLGTDKKAVTLYQINESEIVSGAVVAYKHNGTTTYLYDYTVFSTENTIVTDNNGKIELWRNNSKINNYNNLQDAVDAANTGDTIKIVENMSIESGAYIKDKEITIDGLKNTIKTTSWLNTIFVVGESATLNIKDITFEGEATGFEVDYNSIDLSIKKDYRIPIKTGTDSTDIKRNTSVVISKGNLNVLNSIFSNNYTDNSGGAINVVSGTITINKTELNHNRAKKGGALYIGRNFKAGETNYPVKKVFISDTEISSNFSYGNGGGIMVFNTESVEIYNSKFNTNTGDQASGGALVIEKENVTGYHSMAEKIGLSYIDIKIDNTSFDGNWVGNDGAAIENKDANMVITNTTFTNNYGVHFSSSCGTLSIVTSRENEENKIKLINTVFKDNYGAASTIADHNSADLTMEIIDTTFENNLASYNSILLYGSNTTFKNCKFTKENAGRTIVEIRSYTDSSIVPERNILIEDVTFENNYKNVPDMLIMKNATQNNLYKVTLEGDVKAKIRLWDENNLIVKGNLDGNIITDDVTTEDDIIIEKDGTINGNVTYNLNEKLITIRYPMPSIHFKYYKYIFTEKESFTKKEFYLEHMISLDGHVMELYTDETYTTPWDYTLNDNITIYGKWVEHNHTYDGSLIKYENAIYEQCECGHLGKKINLDIPKDTVYTGNPIPIVIKNEIGLASDKYNVSYYIENNGNWELINDIPSVKGKYKAILTLNDYTIEQIYTITKNETSQKQDNPNTIDNIIICTIGIIISTIMILMYYLSKKQIKIQQ